ncbi:MAG: hypothetical protein LBP22_11990 [Deltaproteobacteria bacterium]|nr:hypothetical protein [Deltaproteobacteria bacterium]
MALAIGGKLSVFSKAFGLVIKVSISSLDVCGLIPGSQATSEVERFLGLVNSALAAEQAAGSMTRLRSAAFLGQFPDPQQVTWLSLVVAVKVLNGLLLKSIFFLLHHIQTKSRHLVFYSSLDAVF